MQWIKRHKVLSVFLGILLMSAGASALEGPAPSPSPEALQASVTQASAPTTRSADIAAAPVEEEESALSNDERYVNSDGESVHSPAYSEDDTVPAGASAQCRDGTYSFSTHRRGTCSYHGGVDEWL